MMQFNLAYTVLLPENPKTPQIVGTKTRTVGISGFAEDRFAAYATCSAALSHVSWTRPETWSFSLDGISAEIPLWILKFEETKISTGWGSDDGSGLKVETFYVVKPFLAFTRAEVSMVETDSELDELCTYVRQYTGMPTAGVLWDTQFDLAVPVKDLSQWIGPYKATYTEKEV
jgi:hypothetical protein